LNNDASALAARSAGDGTSVNMHHFRSVCGDGYVAAVRHGASLHAVVSYARDKEDIDESFGAAAQGSYATASAKASFEKVSKQVKERADLQTRMMQVGGEGEVATTVEKSIAKIQQFGLVTADKAVPVELVVIPYRVLPSLPQALRNQPLPDSGVRGLAAHYWRLSDLASLYYKASITPASYYTPFLPRERLNYAARVTHVATRCLAVMVDYCSQNNVCSLTALVGQAAVKSQCDAINENSFARGEINEEEAMDALRLIVGEPAVSPVPLQARPGVQKWWEEAKTAMMKANSQRTAPESTKAPAVLDPKSDHPWTPYDIYFAWFARAPWQRSVIGTAVAPGDFTGQVAAYCTQQGADCGWLSEKGKLEGEKPQIKDNSNEMKRAQAGLKKFIIHTKLAPVAMAMCDLDRAHPLCQLPDVLPIYMEVALAPIDIAFGNERGFYPTSTPPQPTPAPAQQAPSKPRIPRDSPCGRHISCN